MASVLALLLGAIFVGSGAAGHVELGSSVALGFILVAVPTLPSAFGEAMRVVGARALATVVGSAVVLIADGAVVPIAIATVAAAVLGALMHRVRSTAALAVVLVGVKVEGQHRAEHHVDCVADGLLPYVIGCATVAGGVIIWFAFRRLAGDSPDLPRVRHKLLATDRAALAYAARMGLAVTLAIGVTTQLPPLLVGGHWLITGVLLSIQSDPAATGVRLMQRLSGNTVAAVLAAAVLAGQPSRQVVVALVMVLFLLAFGLRTVNYTWWAITGPPVLLLVSEYPALFPWYEGAVRLSMNLGGAVIVVLVVFGLRIPGRVGRFWESRARETRLREPSRE